MTIEDIKKLLRNYKAQEKKLTEIKERYTTLREKLISPQAQVITDMPLNQTFNKNKILEILLAGRGADLTYLRDRIIKDLNDVAPAILMKTYSQIAKRAAQGAAFIANGLLGGEFEPIIRNLRIKEASGSILDDIFIPFDKDKLISDLD